MKMRNPNVEYRNPKQIRMNKIRSEQLDRNATLISAIRIFEIVSDFGFRISNL